MAIDMIGIRKELNKRGIGNERIGFNKAQNKVLVDNKPFIDAAKISGGTSFADPNAFNTAYNQAFGPTETVKQQTGMSSTTTETGQPNFAQTTNTFLQQLMDSFNNQQPVDPYGTPQYAAQKAMADQRAQDQLRAVQEALGQSGFARSTRLTDRAQRIAGDKENFLQTQIVPQILAQEEAKRQQQFNNLNNVIGLLSGLQNQQFNQDMARDQFGLQQDRFGFQQEQAGIDNEFRQQQAAQAQANLEAEKAYRAERDSEEDQRWFAEYNRRGEQFAQQMGLNWAQLDQRQKEQAADEAYRQDRLQLDRDQFDFQQEQSFETAPSELDPNAYQTNPEIAADFADDASYILNNPEEAKSLLQQNATEFINRYGNKGYRELLKYLPDEQQDELEEMLNSLLSR